MSGGNGSFLWQLFWPMLVDDLVYLLVMGSGKLEGGAALAASSILTGAILFPFYRKRQNMAGGFSLRNGKNESPGTGEQEKKRPVRYAGGCAVCDGSSSQSVF